MFESKRKQQTVVQQESRAGLSPSQSLELRNEVDPDPFIEEMVASLRDKLSTLEAYDEWGRPLAWRNVVRLAVGPVAGQLRDTQTAADLAVALLPNNTAAAVAEAEVLAVVAEAAAEAPVAEVLVAEPPVALIEAAPPTPTLDEAAPAPALEEPSTHYAQAAAELPEPELQARAEVAGSIFRTSGSGPAAISPFTPGLVVRPAPPTPAVKYDRFLTKLYGMGQEDEPRG